MERVIRDGDMRVDIGRASGGRTFVRVVHQPTDTSRLKTGLDGRSSREVAAELQSAVEAELLSRGWAKDAEGGRA